MRFSYAEAMTDFTFYIPLAKAAEAAGYSSMTIPDSIAYPFESDSKYPYTPDGNREFMDGKPFIETFVLTAALGAVTTRLRFNFFVLKLPIRRRLWWQSRPVPSRPDRQPVGLGVGTSPWPEDYELMGVPFAKRGKRIDECIEIVRGLTTGDYFEFHGEFYDIPKTKMTPAPTSRSDPGRWPRRCSTATGGARRWMDAWRRRSGRTRPADRQGQAASRGSGENQPVRNPRDLPGRFHRGRRQAARGQRGDGRHRRFPCPVHHGPDTEPLQTKIRNLEMFAENVIAKV